MRVRKLPKMLLAAGLGGSVQRDGNSRKWPCLGVWVLAWGVVLVGRKAASGWL